MITIERVDVVGNVNGLAGCYIDAPRGGASIEGHVLRIVGWALGSDAPMQFVEVGGGRYGPPVESSVRRRRPDIEVAAPANPHAPTCGFEVSVPLVGLPSHFALWVTATNARGTRHHVATVHGRRTPLDLPDVSGPKPIMVTTLGRTGSTWMTQLLGAHPDILALEPFRLDPRVVSYWAEVCRALATPSSYLAPLLSAEPECEDWWLGRGRTLVDPNHNSHLDHWFATAHISDVAMFCRDRIQAFYRSVAALSGEAHPRFVVEKFNPTWVPGVVWELFPMAKELFLVRDFRDCVASIIDFNRRRGYGAFGRAQFDSDEAYVREKICGDATALLEAWRARRHRALLVRYEDLVLQPGETTATVLAYLGLTADGASGASLVERAELPENETAAHRTASDAQASVGRWRSDLDQSLQRVCEDALGDVLSEFGYGAGRHTDGGRRCT